MTEREEKKCTYCGHEGTPEFVDYYGAMIGVCENCGCEHD